MKYIQNLDSIIESLRKIGMMVQDPSFTHVACLIRNNSLISTGHNLLHSFLSNKTCCGKSTRCSIHAEINALKKAESNKSIKNNTLLHLIVIRVSQTGLLGMSRPCFHCIQQLHKSRFRIHKIFYSNSDGQIICENFQHMIRNNSIYISNGIRKKIQKYISNIDLKNISSDILLQNKHLAKILLLKY